MRLSSEAVPWGGRVRLHRRAGEVRACQVVGAIARAFLATW